MGLGGGGGFFVGNKLRDVSLNFLFKKICIIIDLFKFIFLISLKNKY